MCNPYSLLIRSQAKKKLQSLPRPDRFRIAEKLEQLGRNPDDVSLDIKKLEGESYFNVKELIQKASANLADEGQG